jgi:hypothetical protein
MHKWALIHSLVYSDKVVHFGVTPSIQTHTQAEKSCKYLSDNEKRCLSTRKACLYYYD